MSLALICAAFIAAPSPMQVIDGIRPVDVGTPKYARAFVKQATEGAANLVSPDLFAAGYFSTKAKMMSPLVNTKYTAAQMGVCGTVLGLYDTKLSQAIKSAADRVIKGSKDFDSFTKEEQDAIGKAISAADSPISLFSENRSATDQWQYFAGAYLGTVAAYATVWHISPKQPALLSLIKDAVKGCAEHGAKAEGSSRNAVAENLKGFAKFQGRTLDEAAMREIGAQVEATLRASVAEKYRW
jgi:hypothetical protein